MSLWNPGPLEEVGFRSQKRRGGVLGVPDTLLSGPRPCKSLLLSRKTTRPCVEPVRPFACVGSPTVNIFVAYRFLTALLPFPSENFFFFFSGLSDLIFRSPSDPDVPRKGAESGERKGELDCLNSARLREACFTSVLSGFEEGVVGDVSALLNLKRWFSTSPCGFVAIPRHLPAATPDVVGFHLRPSPGPTLAYRGVAEPLACPPRRLGDLARTLTARDSPRSGPPRPVGPRASAHAFSGWVGSGRSPREREGRPEGRTEGPRL